MTHLQDLAKSHVLGGSFLVTYDITRRLHFKPFPYGITGPCNDGGELCCPGPRPVHSLLLIQSSGSWQKNIPLMPKHGLKYNILCCHLDLYWDHCVMLESLRRSRSPHWGYFFSFHNCPWMLYPPLHRRCLDCSPKPLLKQTIRSLYHIGSLWVIRHVQLPLNL